MFAFVLFLLLSFLFLAQNHPARSGGTHPGLVIIQKEGKGELLGNLGRSWPLAAPAEEESLNKPSPRTTGIISLGLTAAIIYFFNFLNLIFFSSATFTFVLKGQTLKQILIKGDLNQVLLLLMLLAKCEDCCNPEIALPDLHFL